MGRLRSRLGLFLPTWLVAGTALAGDPPVPLQAREALDLRPTQVTIATDLVGRAQAFRATVLSVQDDVLTVLTAARFFGKDDKGRSSRLFVEDGEINGTLLSVTINPAYQPQGARDVLATSSSFPSQYRPAINSQRKLSRGGTNRFRVDHRPASTSLDREVPGADNAIARFRFPSRFGPKQGAVDPALRALRPVASLTASVCPGGSGGDLTARMVDGDGREHAIRAGNYQNPRVLSWGHGFDPKSKDIGGGVFVLRQKPDGQIEPTLIGVNLGPDERGGSASLVALNMTWLSEALRQGVTGTEGGEPSQLNSSPSVR